MAKISWRFIFGLSLFGLAMAFATIALVPSNMEPIFWLVIFAISAIVIARARSTGHFVHGLLVGVVNSIWVTSAHIVFFTQYIASHPREAQMAKAMPLSESPRLMMAFTGPVIGVLSGIVIGLFALVAGKFIRARVPTPAAK